MQEFFLHFVWKYKRFNQSDLRTINGDAIRVIHPGYDHTGSGPDFRMAQIEIAGLTWVGPVEIHVLSRDWYTHGHQSDINYRSVILHVVWKDDKPVLNSKGEPIPTLELNGLVHRKVYERWQQLGADMNWIPCEPFLQYLDKPFWKGHWERMYVDRLESRWKIWRIRLERNNYDWEETLYHFLCRSFGLKENAEPFDQVAIRTPLRIVRREVHSLENITALLIGQSGWFSPGNERHVLPELRSGYSLLRQKYKLDPFDYRRWQYGSVRPSNQPDQRMRHFAKFIFRFPNLVSSMLDIQKPKDWLQIITSTVGRGFGKSKAEIVLVNAVIPFFFYFGKWKGDSDLTEKALNWVEELNAENNHIVRSFLNRNVPVESLLDSQAAHHQFSNYCRPKKCLICSVGKRVLNR